MRNIRRRRHFLALLLKSALTLALVWADLASAKKADCNKLLTKSKAVDSKPDRKGFTNGDDQFRPTDREAGGTQGGNWFKDNENGEYYFGKSYDGDEERVLAENLINQIYTNMGVKVPETSLWRIKGVGYILSKEVPGRVAGSAKSLLNSDILDDFMVDVWLANWDVLGADYDNVIIKNKVASRIDNAGALFWRAQGGDGKVFAATVQEIDSMRDPNFVSGTVFSKITDIQLAGLIRKLIARYATSYASVKSSIALSGLSANLRDQISKTLDSRVRWLVNKGLPRLEQASLADKSRFAEELKWKMGAALWQSELEQVHQLVAKRSPLGKLSDAELVALKSYMGGDFTEINNALWGIVDGGVWKWVPASDRQRFQTEAVRSEIELAVSGLAKLPSFKGRVSRIVGLQPDEIASYRVGKNVTMLGFTSTTNGGEPPYDGNVKFNIKSKTGKSVVDLNPNSGEEEVLFPPGTTFKVLKKEKTKETDDDEGRWVIDLEEQS